MSKKHEKKHDKEYQPASESEQTVQIAVNCENTQTDRTQQSAGDCAEHTKSSSVQEQPADTVLHTKPDADEQGEQKAEKVNAEKFTALEEKCKELQDQYLRKAADFDNYRKRMIREKQEAIEYANTNLISDLLQILDDFDRAIDAGKKVEQESTSAFMQGMVMIRTSLFNLLESKYALQYYEVVGKAFDPDIHEAVATTPSAEVTEPTVGAELQKGYKLKERVIRHAKVMVLMPEQKEKT